jgi:hypothetical protein
MPKTDNLTKGLAVVGTVLVWLPLLAPVFFTVLLLISARRFLFDFLMPAELFPIGLPGALLLLWAAVRARSRVRLIGWSLAIAVALLVGGQALAEVTGLASGATEPAGLWFVLVLGSIAGFCLALAAVGVGGIALLSDLFRQRGSSKSMRPGTVDS